jgi:hypothetical protein
VEAISGTRKKHTTIAQSGVSQAVQFRLCAQVAQVTYQNTMEKQNSLRYAANSINRSLPEDTQGVIDIDDNRARIVLPNGMPISILTMMEIAQTCLLYGCTSYIHNMIARDTLAIVLYYKD